MTEPDKGFYTVESTPKVAGPGTTPRYARKAEVDRFRLNERRRVKQDGPRTPVPAGSRREAWWDGECPECSGVVKGREVVKTDSGWTHVACST